MQDVSIFTDVARGLVILRAPFNPTFHAFINDLAAKWDGELGQWEFPMHVASHVENVAWAFFHTDGSAETCTVEIEVGHWAESKTVELAGRLLLERFSSSRRPRLGQGVVKVSGSWTWPEMATNRPVIGATDAVILAVLPLSAVLQAQERHAGITIVETVTTKIALTLEAKRLSARQTAITAEWETAK